jgi:hypothetical protein
MFPEQNKMEEHVEKEGTIEEICEELQKSGINTTLRKLEAGDN